LAFDETCIFCKIARKQAPSSIIYEDETAAAFLDIRPLNLGHSLVVPKAHYVDIFDIPEKVLCNVHETSKLISPAIKKATKADGISIIQQNGKSAGQDIFHFHIHVVPRFEGQRMPSFNDLKPVERDKLDDMAKRIIQEM
jgi:histidine triad (HIT) family protein